MKLYVTLAESSYASDVDLNVNGNSKAVHFENRKNANGLLVNVAIYMMAIIQTVADISLTKQLLGV